MIPTFVVIPFRDELDLTLNVIDQVVDNGGADMIIMIDNDSELSISSAVAEKLGSINIPAEQRFRKPNGIYALWNYGWRLAEEFAKGLRFNVLFLNNDVTLVDGTIHGLKTALRADDRIGIVYPNYDLSVSDGWDGMYNYQATAGTYKDGGMCGWCFMVRGEEIHNGVNFVDENLKWWCGDDFIEREYRRNDFQVIRLLSMPVDHINEATANNSRNTWTHESKARDLAYYNANYGE